MRRFLLLSTTTVGLVLGLVMGLVQPAAAITSGVPDDGEHPYVGLVVLYDSQGKPLGRCSGTLLSPTAFLTAGHCTSGAASARVYFDEHVSAPPYPYSGGVTGEPHTHPGFDGFKTFPNTSDVGIVRLNEPVSMDTYGALPELRVLDSLATQRGRQDVVFEAVGYGLQGVKPELMDKRNRYKALTKLVNLRSALTDGYNLHTSNAPGIGGGTCFGDSGGPVFRSDNSNVVVAVTSFGLNKNCKGADFAYRVDIAHSQDFIERFV